MHISAEHIARSIDLKKLGYAKHSHDTAMAETASGGYVVIFKYGVSVTIGLQSSEEDAYRREISAAADEPRTYQETERARLIIGKEQMSVYDGVISLPNLSREQVLVIADALAKSVILSCYEEQVNTMFQEIEPIAEQMRRGKILKGKKQLIRTLGANLAIQNAMLSRIRLDDKPDILWDMPELDKLYNLLSSEYEIIERQQILEGRLRMIAETVRSNTEILDYMSSYRVEWYITILILIEIGLTLYEMFIKS